MTIFGSFLYSFKIFWTASSSRQIILVFSSMNENKWTTKCSCSIFHQAKGITKTWVFEFIFTTQVTKQTWFNFSKTFLRSVGRTFRIIWKNWVFIAILQNFGEIYFFLKIRIPFSWALCACLSLLSRLSYFNTLTSCVNIRADSE